MERPYTVETVKDMRGRKITGYRVEQGDRQWRASTASFAVDAREKDIAQACQDRHDPIVLSNSADTWIGCYRFPDGWCYGRLRDRRENGAHEVFVTGSYATRRECERYMRQHVASQSYVIGEYPEYKVIDDACEYLRASAVPPEDIAEHLISIAWQRGVKFASAAGHQVCLSPISPGDVIADGYKRAESERVHVLLRKRQETGVWTPGFQWIEYLRGTQK